MEALCEALQATVQQWRGRFPSPLPLELYTSSNFIGLFVEEQVADVLKQFATDFAAEATRKAGGGPSFDWPNLTRPWWSRHAQQRLRGFESAIKEAKRVLLPCRRPRGAPQEAAPRHSGLQLPLQSPPLAGEAGQRHRGQARL